MTGGGEESVFSLGDYSLAHPLGTFVTILGFIALYVLIEEGGHWVHHRASNRFSQRVLEHIGREAKNFGILSLLLMFVATFLTHDPEILGLVEWVHMVLFFMAVLLVIATTGFFLAMRLTWRRWVRYEQQFDIAFGQYLDDGDPLPLHELLRKQKRRPFYVTLVRFKQQVMQINPQYRTIGFCRYMKKAQRDYTISFIDLNWRSWVVLAVLAALNSLRAAVISSAHKEHTAVSVCWFIAVNGGLPVVVLIALYVPMARAFAEVTAANIAEDDQDSPDEAPVLQVPLLDTCNPGGNRDSAAQSLQLALQAPSFEIDRRTYFWKGDPTVALRALQAVMLSIVFLLTILIISMAWESWHFSLGPVVPLAAATPPTLFMILGPTLLQRLAIIASTGNLLDNELLVKIAKKDADSSRRTRQNSLDGASATRRIQSRLASLHFVNTAKAAMFEMAKRMSVGPGVAAPSEITRDYSFVAATYDSEASGNSDDD
eukprot:TRINITY_DN12199_c0_g1_i1.p1 TRINITY_DN12199_c0_g1~~TRINITY_DN12199_c0_g1_i1.p1  ORF type:complete len:496 (+),score=91.85 TRINITY_DN12199_c0_g1_i1:31-1488(+)